MKRLCKHIFFLYFYCYVKVESFRKYDIDAEARKLYGNDIKTVVQDFRKSNHYLTILEHELDKISQLQFDNIEQLETYHKMLLKNKTHELMFGTNDIETSTKQSLRNFRVSVGMLNLLTNTSTDVPVTTTVNPAVRLKHFYNRMLPVSEINKYRDLGFEYAGILIHSFIKSLGDDDEISGDRFTWSADFTPKGKTVTTEHEEHKVNHEVPHNPLELVEHTTRHSTVKQTSSISATATKLLRAQNKNKKS